MKQLIVFLFIFFAASYYNTVVGYTYKNASSRWEEKLGDQRAVISVAKPANALLLKYYWRRPDANVDKHLFLIVNAETGDTVKNIQRINVNNEMCELRFGPVKQKGTYYFYYLPYQVSIGNGYYGGNYYPHEKTPDSNWLKTISKTISEASIVEVQARTPFDSFYPMEITALSAEKDAYRKRNPKTPFYIFPEDRKNPIRMRENIPQKWMSYKQGNGFTGSAAPNEYYTFQVGIWTPDKELKNIAYHFTDLKSSSETILSKDITCFNTEGIDPFGKPFKKQVNVASGKVQALWFGIDIAKNQPTGIYTGNLTISDENGDKQIIPVRINVSGKEIEDRGDSEPWRHSRLRWLNSTLGISDTPIKPYIPVSFNKNTISVLGRDITVDLTTGLPQQIDSWNNPILSEPIKFIIETQNGIKKIPLQVVENNKTDGSVTLQLKGEDDEFIVECYTVSEFDGWSDYTYKVIPKKDIEVKDIRLEIPMNKNTARYFMGAGLPGQDMPRRFEGKWDAPVKKADTTIISMPTNESNSWLHPFDSFWMGNALAGLHCELRGTSYSGPLLNLYRPAYPPSWYNEGKGGFSLKENEKGTQMTVYSGSRKLKMNDPITFEFATIITPVKPINYKSQFTDRYYHNGGKPVPTEEDVKAGVKIINVHHANYLNPVINYPFLTVDKMKNFIDTWHKKGCKVKIYYTIRELTSAVTEIWALRSLGHEILGGGNGGGFPWLREHFGNDYTPQWYHHFEPTDSVSITADASVLTSPSESRWFNYYVEGLAWLVKNADIDGLYLDDVSYDRRILKRMRRAMSSVKDDCIIDLHSNTGFSRGPAMQYAEYFPYVDKLWFGESFMYNQMSPANWLVEVSGIPFGLMGDMLHRGGNRWLGMQYGMTVRHPWLTDGILVDPRPIWKVWDDFGIKDSKMIGFWEDNPPVTSDNPDVKITTYLKKDSVLISIGNYSTNSVETTLNIDWSKIGLTPENTVLEMPEIKDFQPAATMKPTDKISINPKKGWLIYLVRK